MQFFTVTGLWRLALTSAALVLLLSALPARTEPTTVNIVHFSDYHSHAVPFYSEGAHQQAGIARGIAYLQAQRKADPDTLILSGGDTMNKGSPLWSDEYQCAEWAWFNGLVDAMALGNHEFDYGQDTFSRCRATAHYPVLSANYVGADGKALFLVDNKPYLVKIVKGIKLGIFALADSDFDKLIGASHLPSGARFADRVETARRTVATLRETEKVQAVIVFGHAYRESDTALAQAVPGIDLVLGTHSHYKGELERIPHTQTQIISPFQYLTYFSNVQMVFEGGKLDHIAGKLVRMDEHQRQDPSIVAQVLRMQKALEAKYPERFKTLGRAAVELNDHNISNNESVLGNWALDVVRAAAATHAFFSTASSFRASIAPGPITHEDFLTAIPYKNAIVVCLMSGRQLAELIHTSVSRRDTDSFSQVSGVRFTIVGREARDIKVLVDPHNAAAGFEALELDKIYTVGTTDFQARISGAYKDLFSGANTLTNTGKDIGSLLTDAIIRQGTVSAQLDGRMGGDRSKPELPASGPTH